MRALDWLTKLVAEAEGLKEINLSFRKHYADKFLFDVSKDFEILQRQPVKVHIPAGQPFMVHGVFVCVNYAKEK